MHSRFMFVIGLILCLLLMGGIGNRGKVRYRHLRGLRLSTLWQTRVVLMPWQDQRKTFVWGRFRLPMALASQHFLVAGTVGSGKTLMLRLLMQSVLPWIGRGEGHRALVYDGKGDLLNIILGMKQDYQTVFTFDPFDPEGVRWDIAGDVTDDASANQIARLLFPKQDGENQPFFPESVQNIAATLMQILNDIATGQWRLSHLLFIMRSADRIMATMELTEKGRDTLSQFIHSGETWGNITAVISNRINDYEIVAALWDHAPHAISMKEWNETESILVLRKHHHCSDVVDAVNRVLLAMAKRLLLSKPETPQRRTWVILDELASLGGKGASKELNLLMEQGRSRNVCVALGFQNMASLRDEFTQYGADRLVALCSTKVLLRFEEYISAQWAAEFLGKQEVRVESVSTSSSSGGASSSSSKTTTYQDQERWTVMPAEFLATPLAGATYGVTGYFMVPEGNPPLAFRDTLPSKWLFGGQTLAPIAKRQVNERDPAQQRSMVTEADLCQLLGLALPATSSAQSGPPVPNPVSPAQSAAATAAAAAANSAGGAPTPPTTAAQPVLPPSPPAAATPLIVQVTMGNGAGFASPMVMTVPTSPASPQAASPSPPPAPTTARALPLPPTLSTAPSVASAPNASAPNPTGAVGTTPDPNVMASGQGKNQKPKPTSIWSVNRTS